MRDLLVRSQKKIGFSTTNGCERKRNRRLQNQIAILNYISNGTCEYTMCLQEIIKEKDSCVSYTMYNSKTAG